MKDTERIERITSCIRSIDPDNMTRDELMIEVENLSISEIMDLIWDMYRIIIDINDTLKM